MNGNLIRSFAGRLL